jgi:hypothetical protein
MLKRRWDMEAVMTSSMVETSVMGVCRSTSWMALVTAETRLVGCEVARTTSDIGKEFQPPMAETESWLRGTYKVAAGAATSSPSCFTVADDADDLFWPFGVERQGEVFANRILVWPEALGQSFTDESYGGPVGGVRGVKLAALAERHAKGLNISRGDKANVNLGLLGHLSDGTTFNNDRLMRTAAVQRQVVDYRRTLRRVRLGHG